LGRRPKTSPFLGFEESDITNWSPRVRVRGKINPLPHAPRQHEPSDSTPIPFETLVENCRTASTPATLKGSLKFLRDGRRSTGLSKRTSRDQFHPRRNRPERLALNRAKPRPHVLFHPVRRRQNDPN